MNLLPDQSGVAMVQCASFGDGCSFLVGAESGRHREPFGDVVPDPELGSLTRRGCPECGGELLEVEKSL